MTNREIATKIYEKLLEKGAGIGNASIPFIEKVLDDSIPMDAEVGMPSENSFGQWVDVNEKLPKEHIDVLGADNEGEMRVCWLDSYNNGFYMTNGEDKIPYTQIEITHWMPLPKF